MEGLMVLLVSFSLIGVTSAWEICENLGVSTCDTGCCSTSSDRWEHCCTPEEVAAIGTFKQTIGAIVGVGALGICVTCGICCRRASATAKRIQTVAPTTTELPSTEQSTAADALPVIIRNITYPTIYININNPGDKPQPRVPSPSCTPIVSTIQPQPPMPPPTYSSEGSNFQP